MEEQPWKHTAECRRAQRELEEKIARLEARVEGYADPKKSDDLYLGSEWNLFLFLWGGCWNEMSTRDISCFKL